MPTAFRFNTTCLQLMPGGGQQVCWLHPVASRAGMQKVGWCHPRAPVAQDALLCDQILVSQEEFLIDRPCDVGKKLLPVHRFLLVDRLSDCRLVPANRRDRVPTSPAMLSGIVLTSPEERPRNVHRRFPLHEAYDMGHRILGGSTTTYGHDPATSAPPRRDMPFGLPSPIAPLRGAAATPCTRLFDGTLGYTPHDTCSPTMKEISYNTL